MKQVSLETVSRQVNALVLEYGLYYAALETCEAYRKGDKTALAMAKNKGDILFRQYKDIDSVKAVGFMENTLRQVVMATLAGKPLETGYEPLSGKTLRKLHGQVQILKKRGVSMLSQKASETLEEALSRTVSDTVPGPKVYRQEETVRKERAGSKKSTVIKDYVLTA